MNLLYLNSVVQVVLWIYCELAPIYGRRPVTGLTTTTLGRLVLPDFLINARTECPAKVPTSRKRLWMPDTDCGLRLIAVSIFLVALCLLTTSHGIRRPADFKSRLRRKLVERTPVHDPMIVVIFLGACCIPILNHSRKEGQVRSHHSTLADIRANVIWPLCSGFGSRAQARMCRYNDVSVMAPLGCRNIKTSTENMPLYLSSRLALQGLPDISAYQWKFGGGGVSFSGHTNEQNGFEIIRACRREIVS